jgi:hypothetical protein
VNLDARTAEPLFVEAELYPNGCGRRATAPAGRMECQLVRPGLVLSGHRQVGETRVAGLKTVCLATVIVMSMLTWQTRCRS